MQDSTTSRVRHFTDTRLLVRTSDAWAEARYAIGAAIERAGRRVANLEPLNLDAEFETGHRIGYGAGRRDGAMFMAGGAQS
jgi:hypothetical protein